MGAITGGAGGLAEHLPHLGCRAVRCAEAGAVREPQVGTPAQPALAARQGGTINGTRGGHIWQRAARPGPAPAPARRGGAGLGDLGRRHLRGGGVLARPARGGRGQGEVRHGVDLGRRVRDGHEPRAVRGVRLLIFTTWDPLMYFITISIY